MTSFKIGGNVDKIYFPTNEDDMIFLLDKFPDSLILGSCSNLLISSNGICQNIISTTKMNQLEFDSNIVIADCGVKGPMAAQAAQKNDLSGFEFMIGFPGSIGGNLYMNASAHGVSISDSLIEAKVYDKINKKVLTLTKNELNFGYRKSILQEGNLVLLKAKFQLVKADSNEIKNLMDKNLEFRKSHQPAMSLPSAGSVFKNPEGHSAGQLLDEAGMKGVSYCGAEIWSNHANFIVNTNNATSQDVLELMLLMYNAVESKFGIKLKPEIKYIGKKTPREDEICKILSIN